METILAEYEIKSLIQRERYYRDVCEWDKLRDSWHPDPSKTNLEVSWYTGDIDGFIQGSKARANGPLSLFHTITPIEVIIRGPRALVESTGTICARFERDMAEYDLTAICRYTSRVEKVKSAEAYGWRLLEFIIIFVQDSIVPVAPQQGPHSLKFENLSSRKGFRYSGWLQAQTGTAGVSIGDKLPHAEDMDRLGELKEKGLEWLG